METRASHVLVGSFVLVLVAALFGFIIWLARVDAGATKDFDIMFYGSVAGLNQGSLVNYNGVPVGTVTTIALVRDQPSAVRVRIRVSEDTPVYTGTTASLESQGLTGAVLVQLSGATQAGTPLVEPGPFGVPVIPSKRSALEKLFVSIPEILQRTTDVLDEIKDVLNDKNKKAIGDILANTERLTGTLADQSPLLASGIQELNGAIVDLRGSLAAVTQLADGTTLAVNEDAKPLLRDLRTLAQNTDSAVRKIDDILKDAQPGLSAFGQDTLPEIGLLVSDLRELTHTLNRLGDRIDQGSAASLLSSEKIPEYRDASKK